MDQPTGKVIRVRDSRSGGYGFIRADGAWVAKEFFFHATDCEGGSLLPVGTQVRFMPSEPNKAGQELRAAFVVPISPAA
jgi:cold shock CspA family protein